MRLLLPVMGIIFFSVQTRPALADSYQWVDNGGTVHFTDNPEELPEPYRSKALKELIEKQKRNQQIPHPKPADGLRGFPDVSNERLPSGPKEIPPVTAPESSAAPDTLGQETDTAAKKKLWKEKVKQAQQKVSDLTSLCDAVRLELGKATNTRAIYSRPADMARTVKADEELKRCEHDLEQARRYLEDGLPDEARRAGIPPGWLR